MDEERGADRGERDTHTHTQTNRQTDRGERRRETETDRQNEREEKVVFPRNSGLCHVRRDRDFTTS